MGTSEEAGGAITSRMALIQAIRARVGGGWPSALLEAVGTALWHRGHALYRRRPSAEEWQALLETQLARELSGQLRPIRLVVVTPAGERCAWADWLWDRVATLAQARERVREAGFRVLDAAPSDAAAAGPRCGVCHEVVVASPEAAAPLSERSENPSAMGESVSPDLSAYRPQLTAFLADPAQDAAWFTFGPVRCYLRKGFRRMQPTREDPAPMRVLELANVETEERGVGWGHALLRLLTSAGVPIYAENVLCEALVHLLEVYGFRRIDETRMGLMGDYCYEQGDQRQIVSPVIDPMARSTGRSPR